MRHSAIIIADSISKKNIRLTTMEVVIPRIVLAEFNTHRVFSRNSSSSRAIPIEKIISKVNEHPYIPTYWGLNQKGMAAQNEANETEKQEAIRCWLKARDLAVAQSQELYRIGIHKQTVNRLLEPFMWQTIIVTATDWSNYFNLRCNPSAHPDINITADLMRNALKNSRPKLLKQSEWHLPFITEEERAKNSDRWCISVAVGRCARVSYLTHNGIRDPAADVELHDRLLKSGHLSPFEHVARPRSFFDIVRVSRSNFKGWTQYRKLIPHEQDILAFRK